MPRKPSDAPIQRPYFRFFTSDWRADAPLRSCSSAARGLWIDLLTLMHESERYGYLLIAVISPSPKQLGSLLGIAEREVKSLLQELELSKVFSRTSDGIIFSRRMVRDYEKSVADRKNGVKGGNPNFNPPPEENEGKNTGPPVALGVNPQHKPHGRSMPFPLKEESSKATSVSKPPARDPSPPTPASHREPDPLRTGLADVIVEADGVSRVNGESLELAERRVVDAANIDLTKWQGDLRPLIRWLADGLMPDDIVTEIRRIASRPSYKVPNTLHWFDAPVRNACKPGVILRKLRLAAAAS